MKHVSGFFGLPPPSFSRSGFGESPRNETKALKGRNGLKGS